MPLRDHFRPPLDDVHAWDEVHGMLPAVIVQHLIKILPEPYFAAPQVHLGTLFEVDIGAFEGTSSDRPAELAGSAVVAYAPPKPTLTFEPRLPNQDVYEVRIFDSRRKRRLVAAIEIVSPSNKDRPESRSTFVSKAATLLQHGICVSMVDIVSTLEFNLYGELLDFVEYTDTAVTNKHTPLYAATVRTRLQEKRRMMDTWYHPLVLGSRLPILPIWLTETWPISLDLDACYEEVCRTLRIG